MAGSTVSASAGPAGARALPSAVAAALSPAQSVDEAQAFTRQLARSHYENFSVVSVLLPKHLRQDFCNVYAFCRVADDLGDELHDPQASLEELAKLRKQTQDCFAGRTDSTLFAALSETIRRHEIPIEPFLDLIDAFEQDQRITRYETFDQLLDYCRHSANPVGRIVLYMCGYRDEQRQKLSDLTCSALQLANFWQDVRRDLVELDRIYLPGESMRKFDLTEDDLREAINATDRAAGSSLATATAKASSVMDRYRDLIGFEVDLVEAMFDMGEELLRLLDPAFRGHIALFGKGGRAILQAIRDCDYDTLSARPSLSAWQKGRLVLSAVGAKLGSRSA